MEATTPEPPPLSIAVDEHWHGFTAPAKTWDELLALGLVRILTYGRIGDDEPVVYEL
jgi:hypothetical protein